MVFEKIKRERYDRFIRCFDHVANKIDDVYKVIDKFLDMCQNNYFSKPLISDLLGVLVIMY